jgi:hypothetical protein
LDPDREDRLRPAAVVQAQPGTGRHHHVGRCQPLQHGPLPRIELRAQHGAGGDRLQIGSPPGTQQERRHDPIEVGEQRRVGQVGPRRPELTPEQRDPRAELVVGGRPAQQSEPLLAQTVEECRQDGVRRRETERAPGEHDRSDHLALLRPDVAVAPRDLTFDAEPLRQAAAQLVDPEGSCEVDARLGASAVEVGDGEQRCVCEQVAFRQRRPSPAREDEGTAPPTPARTDPFRPPEGDELPELLRVPWWYAIGDVERTGEPPRLAARPVEGVTSHRRPGRGRCASQRPDPRHQIGGRRLTWDDEQVTVREHSRQFARELAETCRARWIPGLAVTCPHQQVAKARMDRQRRQLASVCGHPTGVVQRAEVRQGGVRTSPRRGWGRVEQREGGDLGAPRGHLEGRRGEVVADDGRTWVRIATGVLAGGPEPDAATRSGAARPAGALVGGRT